MALQILQQWDVLFEPLQILGHGVDFASRVERRRKAAVFPGKDGGRRQSFCELSASLRRGMGLTYFSEKYTWLTSCQPFSSTISVPALIAG